MSAAIDTLVRGLQVACGQGAGRILVLGARPHDDLKSWNEVVGWQPFKPWADAWTAAGFAMSCGSPKGKWPVVACLPGKSKEEILHQFGVARDLLEPGGILIAALPNQAGAGRFEKQLATATGNVESVSKNKCRAFWARDDGSWDESLFSEWLDLGRPQCFGTEVFQTVPGVFSAGRVDPGSRFLVEHLPGNLQGKIADLGAGWGFLSHHVLSSCPKVAQIDLYEADSRALDCAKSNLLEFKARTSFHWHDVMHGISGSYDAIIMNPPFHTGQDQDAELGRGFLTAASRALRRNGRLFLVANRQLPYETHLDSLGLGWRSAGENPVYKLLFATA